MEFRIFEAIMLICFGASWPAAIYKSYKSRKVGSKSLLFMVLIIIGYVAGIINKAIYSPDIIIALYALNIIMVLTDIALYFRNKRIESQEAAGGKEAEA